MSGSKTRKAPVLIAGAALVLVLFSIVALVFFSQPDRKPNLLILSIDTLRADHLGAYGYGVDTSPNLDAFARERGILFETVVAAAPSTTPSHASMFTSLLPAHHGALFSRRSPLSPDRTTMAEIFKAEGYRTACINDGGQMDAVWGLSQGFDEYITLPGVCPKAKLARNAKEALRWLEDASVDERPWFLFLHTYETHHPYNAEARYYSEIGHEYSGDLPMTLDKDILKRINDGKLELKEADRHHIIAAYDAEIRSMDAALADLLDRLERRGLMDETVVIITSDHGEELGEHGMMGWHSHALWDEQLLVPLVIRLPGDERAGARVVGQARGIDLLPTVLQLLSMASPPEIEGRSLVSMIDGTDTSPRPAVSQRDTVVDPLPASIRIGEKKLYRKEGAENPLLFDTAADPREQRDLFEESAGDVEILEAALDRIVGERPLAKTPGTVEIEEATAKQLKALGYIDDPDAAPPGGDR